NADQLSGARRSSILTGTSSPPRDRSDQEFVRMSTIRPWTWAAPGLFLLAAACQRNDAGLTAEAKDQKPDNKIEAKNEEPKEEKKQDASDKDWPCFRGPERSGVSKETGLAKEWPKGGPKLLWKSDKGGKGFAGMAVVKGVVYTMGARDGD